MLEASPPDCPTTTRLAPAAASAAIFEAVKSYHPTWYGRLEAVCAYAVIGPPISAETAQRGSMKNSAIRARAHEIAIDIELTIRLHLSLVPNSIWLDSMP